MKTNKAGLRVLINGVVQAVGFRPFIYRIAIDNDLTGWVKNLGDAGVEVLVQGEESHLEAFLVDLREKKPPLAEIDTVETEYVEFDEGITEFSIKKSSSGSSGSGTIPPDIATCDDCLEDVFGDTRYSGYWATSCVNCGPRFSVIRSLPYDRDKTSMDDFPMCPDCHEEYTDPVDRRYHAQTIACPACGPILWYEMPNGKRKFTRDPINRASAALRKGNIIAIKGLGGTHIACDATNEGAVARARKRLNRPQQPFAVMGTEEHIAEGLTPSPSEWESLKSPRRPIVLIRNPDENWVSTGVAPGLHTIGVMLPYTALHHLIFAEFDRPLVMTSANMPGQPMLIDNERIKEKLAGVVDGYTLHDREVVSRIDDSVVRHVGGFRKFIRRSRGWVPEAIEVDLGDERLLALGAEQDNVIGLYKEGKVYLSQYLGDTTGPNDLTFLETAMDRIFKLTNSELPERIAHDHHPDFLTTELANELGTKTVAVQHHKAHVGSMLAETGINEMVGITLDGVGYGDDGTIWGGEVITHDKRGFHRDGSLTPAYMPGGDLATTHPARMVAGILYPKFGEKRLVDLRSVLEQTGIDFPGGKEELEIILRQLQGEFNLQVTSSAGRFLDAVSAMLDICNDRTYEGEPAMRLEATADPGVHREIDLPIIQGDDTLYLDQSKLLLDLIDLSEKLPRADVAATAQWALAKGMSRIALKIADETGIERIGFSGGVAINEKISSTIRKTVEGAGVKFVTNTAVPVGDGGVALGQLWIAGNRDRTSRSST
ncbi:carbamoyltransferase HypF [Candidatus Bipolaricaulota bacterium]|nr:carbamoyltransferase HypF [Candidatus Bipolaricaulota bacterium]